MILPSWAITYTGTWNGGLFRIADDTQPFAFGANTFTLDYNDGGQSVTIIAVPEPTATAAPLGGLALFAGLRRRRPRTK